MYNTLQTEPLHYPNLVDDKPLVFWFGSVSSDFSVLFCVCRCEQSFSLNIISSDYFGF